MTDPKCDSKSQNDFSDGFLLSQKAMIWFWEAINGFSAKILPTQRLI